MQKRVLFVLAGLLVASSSQAAVITGQITGWLDSSAPQTIGDGVNNVQMWWSVNAFGSTGWFYGHSFKGIDSDVSAAPEITDVNQIVNAAARSFTANSVGPLNDAGAAPDHIGDFVVYRNTSTGYFGVLRIDDINVDRLTATWWFQTDGTGNFQTLTAAPEPSAMMLCGAGLVGLALVTRRRYSRRQQ